MLSPPASVPAQFVAGASSKDAVSYNVLHNHSHQRVTATIDVRALLMDTVTFSREGEPLNGFRTQRLEFPDFPTSQVSSPRGQSGPIRRNH